MKHIYINLFAITLLASLAFGQADSLNMSLVDEWTTIVDYDWSGIDMVDNYVVAALGEKLMVLELSATGELTPIDSMFFRANQVAYKDSFIYIMQFPPEGPGILVYKIGATGNIDSVSALSLGSVGNILQVEDTLLYTYFGTGHGVFQIISISDAVAPTLTTYGSLAGYLVNPSAFWGEYPYLYNGGHNLTGEIPDM